MSATPRRVQMTRHRPWRSAHPDAVRVDRSTRWGNPFTVDQHGRAGAVERYRHALLAGDLPGVAGHRPVTVDDIRAQLAGRDLACWCPLTDASGNPPPCHADVLLKIAATAGSQLRTVGP